MAAVAYLVGAGPGDPSLLTLRAAELLGSVSAVVHDQGVPPGILRRAGAAERLLCRDSEEAVRLLVQRVRSGRSAARLFAGDPCADARLEEEARSLARAGVEIEVVPGVSLASGAAAYAGIPLVGPDGPWVVLEGDARKGGGSSQEIWAALVRAGATLAAVLRGREAAAFASRLLGAGVPPSTPVSLVVGPTLPDQEVRSGRLDPFPGLEGLGAEEPLLVLVVGPGSAPRAELSWLDRKPLWGKRILVTRAANQVEEFSAILASRGAVPVELPLIALRPAGHRSVIEAALRRLFAYDWVIFTSGNAVEFTFQRLEELQLDARSFGAARVCAVGPKTAEALVRRGIRPDVVPERYVAESLVEALLAQARLEGSSVLIPRAKEAREVVPQELEKQGARVDVLPLYENVHPEAVPSDALEALRAGRVAMATFASSSAARNYAELCRERGLDPTRVPCAVIGPATRRTAESLGLPIAVEPTEYTLEGMVAAMEEYFRGAADHAKS